MIHRNIDLANGVNLPIYRFLCVLRAFVRVNFFFLVKRCTAVRRVLLWTLPALVFVARAACGADLGTPRLSDSIATQKYFDPERFLSSGGVKYEASPSFTLEPQLGVGYEKLEMETGSGSGEVFHKLHAQAGGRVDLPGMLYFSASAKLPVYTYEMAGNRSAGVDSFQYTTGRQSYDLFNRSGQSLSWTGEAGIHLGLGTDLNIFYDQTPFSGSLGGSRSGQMEERFGTRFIFHFR
jgi:hypothetical protein